MQDSELTGALSAANDTLVVANEARVLIIDIDLRVPGALSKTEKRSINKTFDGIADNIPLVQAGSVLSAAIEEVRVHISLCRGLTDLYESLVEHRAPSATAVAAKSMLQQALRLLISKTADLVGARNYLQGLLNRRPIGGR